RQRFGVRQLCAAFESSNSGNRQRRIRNSKSFPKAAQGCRTPKPFGESSGWRRPVRRVPLAALIQLLAHPAIARAVEATWKFGAAQAKITPQKLFWMGGFGSR